MTFRHFFYGGILKEHYYKNEMEKNMKEHHSVKMKMHKEDVMNIINY
jgi:hypothetical protein